MGTARALALLCISSLVATVLSQSPACHTYVSNGVARPSTPSLSDAIMVPDAYPVGDARVTVDLSHRRVGALKVSLTAQPVQGGASGETVVLKDRGLGRRGNNLYGTTFADAAARGFPEAADAAPFPGAFRPTQKLSFLYPQGGAAATAAGAGGSQGAWVLHVEDVAPNSTRRHIHLNGWSLVLCERGAESQPQPQPLAPASPTATIQAPPAPEPAPQPAPRWEPSPSQWVPQASPAPQVAVPPVSAYSGPTDPSPPQGPQGPAPQAQGVPARGGWFGWQVVTKSGSSPPEPEAPLPLGDDAAPGPAPAYAPWAPLSTIRASINSHVQRGYGGCAGPQCQAAKDRLWRAVVFGLYAHALAEAHGVAKADSKSLLDKLHEVLPGDNPRISKLEDWVAGHEAQVAQVGAALKEQFGAQLAKIGVAPGGDGPLQQLVASFRDGTADRPLKQLLDKVKGGGAGSLAALQNLFGQDGAGAHLGDLFGHVHLGGGGGLEDMFAQFMQSQD